jgi:disulfide bond formation protein DsbB
MNLLRLIPAPLFVAQMALLSMACLGFALIGQYGFNLHPCELCIYQRIPFGIVIALGLIGFAMPRTAMAQTILIGLAFATNAGIALFHSGVERKWWEGLKGCSTPDMSGTIEDLMARIQSAAVTRCDEIPWNLFGLSMANYNVIVCGGLAALCAIYVVAKNQKPA